MVMLLDWQCHVTSCLDDMWPFQLTWDKMLAQQQQHDTKIDA